MNKLTSALTITLLITSIQAQSAGTKFPPPLNAGTKFPPPVNAGTKFPPPANAGTKFPPPVNAGTKFPPPANAGTKFPPPTGDIVASDSGVSSLSHLLSKYFGF